MKPALHVLMIAFVLAVSSCNRIKDKGQELADTALKAGKEAETDALDEVIPRFDAYTPDTKYNKERFSEFLNVELTPDVKNIYCHGDALGIDASYQFAFNCDTSTARKIIEVHQLKPDSVSGAVFHDFPWWDLDESKKITCYTHEGAHRYFSHFWYDQEKQKGYYSTYDM